MRAVIEVDAERCGVCHERPVALYSTPGVTRRPDITWYGQRYVAVCQECKPLCTVCKAYDPCKHRP